MRVLLQRVSRAEVRVGERTAGKIDRGFLILVGFTNTDDYPQVEWMADKIVGLRLFSDSEDKMNLALADVGGEVLVVSQFTLYGDARKGRRPSFSDAAGGAIARPIFDSLCERVQAYGIQVEKGAFGEMMQVHLVNDGPVTILLDSRRGF